jgi:hypothetical protein
MFLYFVVCQPSSKIVDVRDRLPIICAAPKVLKRFHDKVYDFEEAYDHAIAAGGDALAAAFRPLRLVPILVPEDQRPGDVYQLLTWTLKSRRDECFSNLPSDGPSLSRLLDSTSIKDISGSLALGITKWISAGTNAALKDVVVLKFFDEQSYVLSQKALGLHLLASCPELAPIINESWIPVSTPADLRDKAPLLAILGRVIYAKRRIFVGVTSSADLSATVTSIGSLLSSNKALSVVPLDASASAKLGVGNERGVVIEDTSVLPVAFSPAFLPDIILSTDLGGEAKPTAVVWKPVDGKLFDTWYDREYHTGRP